MNYLYGNNLLHYKNYNKGNNSIALTLFLLVNCDVLPDYAILYQDWEKNRYRKFAYMVNGGGVDLRNLAKNSSYHFLVELMGNWDKEKIFDWNTINYFLTNNNLQNFINQENY